MPPTLLGAFLVTAIVIAMVAILAISAVIVAYVAWPHRGADMPAVPWLGDAMNKAVDSLPTVDPIERELELQEARRDG